MTRTPAQCRRGFLARLVTLLVALGALPLMAPTCGGSGEGYKVFSKKSLIIPMDVCYQCTLESGLNTKTGSCTATSYRTPLPAPGNKFQGLACPQGVDKGDVIKSYGLVYQLIRNKIAVYWIIKPEKRFLDEYDLTLQYSGGLPALLYDWNSGGQGGAPTASSTINYMGGAFVVDGADYDRASAVLQSLKGTFADKLDGTPGVNVHVSNIAFRGYAMKTMAGGWDAGGTVPPKLALFDIGSGNLNSTETSIANPKNSEGVIQGYLARAGIGLGTAGGTATGTHGEIYDRLGLSDFQPSTAGGAPATSRLFTNAYALLWMPHWVAPGSCSDVSSATACFNSSPACTTGCAANRYTTTQVDQVLKTIGAFVGQGNDVFAECAGLGSLEGVFKAGVTGTAASDYTVDYKQGASDGSTRFQTTAGVRYNELQDVSSASGTQLPGPLFIPDTPPSFVTTNLSSPLLQIGDFPFVAFTGAVEDYRPQNSTTYQPGTTRLVGAYPDPAGAGTTTRGDSFKIWDYFTYRRPGVGHGSIVYLAGHSYSGTEGTFQVAGSRLVLNTLFNLGASCTSSGISCSTGLPGVCSAGTFQCQNGQPVCVPTVQPGTRVEICNGLDDDCDWEIDEGLQTECYQAPPGYIDPEPNRSTTFFESRNMGVCRPGISVCQNVNGTYAMSACAGQVLPAAESCNGLDDDCDGHVDESLAQGCYDGPASSLCSQADLTAGVSCQLGQPKGECRGGSQVCQNGAWGSPAGGGFIPGACGGEVLPVPEICSDTGIGGAKDDDCDGKVNNGCTCVDGTTQSCFSGPGIPGVGTCLAGTQTCLGGVWGECNGEVVADIFTPEACVSGTTYVKSADTNCDNATTKCPECLPGQTQSCYGPDPLVLPSVAGRGQCTWGTQSCVSGKWAACPVGGDDGYGLPSAVETCDGKDNTCSGPRVASPDGRYPASATPRVAGYVVDKVPAAVCPDRFACEHGVCVPDACGTELPPPEGYTCNPGGDANGVVVLGTCGVTAGGAPQTCVDGALCQYGTCVDPCPPAGTGTDVCGSGTICGGGACIAGGCYETGCPAGDLCLAGACAADACAGRICPSGTFCRQGDCVQACTFVSCFTGEKCGIDGFCEPDLCAGRSCNAGERCTAGVCAVDPCLGKGCARGQVCKASGGDAVCVDDPCAGVVCPAGVCAEGQCFPTGNRTGAGTLSRTSSSSAGGCDCGSGGGAAFPALLALLAAPFVRRRRARVAGPGAARSGLVLLLVAVALTAAACKTTKDEFDPSKCQATCGEQRCVDTASDPSHCGGCANVCGGGQQCVDSVCGPSASVAPYIRSLSPTTGAKDDPSVTVTLSGERFQADATVRMETPLGPRTVPCPAAAGGACQWLSAGSIRVLLDLTGAPVASGTPPWKLRVVNPDLVISNAVSFAVIVPVPSIAGVVPNEVLAGSTTTLVVSPMGTAGTGFTAGSQCHLQGPSIGEIALPTTLDASGDQLSCLFDASGVLPGSYSLTVVSETNVRSNEKTVTVTPSDPVVFAIDPTTASTSFPLTVTGARFDSTSRVLFYPQSVLMTLAVPLAGSPFVDSGRLFVAKVPLPDTGNYFVAVRNGTAAPFKYSNTVSFSVGGAVSSVTSFSPATAFQGDPAVNLQFVGSFPQTSVIELQSAGGTTFAQLTSTTSGCAAGTCTGISAAQSLIGGAEGTWYARVRFGPAGSPASGLWPLRVLSNQAILRDYAATPDPEQAGSVGGRKDAIAFQVANIHGVGADFSGVKVYFVGPVDAVATTIVLDPTSVVNAGSTAITTGPLSLVGLSSGTYSFTVRNPNASPSNALTFAVTPGAPTLTSVCVKGTSCVRQAQRSGTPLVVTLTGTNFATPDVNGNGSSVMVAADFMPNWPNVDPCGVSTTTGTQFEPVPGTITVKSATQIELSLDTTAAYVDPDFGTTYYVGVWNPGGTGGPQKSSCGKDPRTLPSFRIMP
ncbi:MAG TPA: MopE-related protein [Anaeromyxobacter sp.]